MTAEPQTLRGALPVPAEVRAYLDQFEGLASLIPEVCAALRAEFGDGAELALELYTSPAIFHQAPIFDLGYAVSSSKS